MNALPAGIRDALAGAVRPPERCSPSEWAARYRRLAVGTTEKPGKWDNDYFPHLVPIMDAHEEALLGDWEGLVLMKGAQGGGSEGEINTVGWARSNFEGPMLYLISKDDVAKEFGRERFDYMNATCEPLKRIHVGGRGSGETVQIKRYVTGKLVIQGGRSVLNIESNPYLIVWVDELDSLQDVISGKGDLIKNIKARSKAFRCRTLIVAFAHPTTRDRGAGRIYYDLSDQRRGYVGCPHCAGEFWLNWEHVKVIPGSGETLEQAQRDPTRYHLVAPCCGVIVTDGERWGTIQRGIRQKSTLSPEIAAKKTWIGVHFSELYYPHVTLRSMAQEWIEGIDNEPIRRVTINKSHGDTFEAKIRDTKPDEWRSCIWIPRSPSDPHAYTLGQIPPGVTFLTAGQDSRSVELHWSVWGWGLVRNADDYPELVGWLIDCGVVERDFTETIEASDLFVFDQLLLQRAFPRTSGDGHFYVARAYLDSGWCPVAVAEYARTRPTVFACRGDAVDSVSARRTPVHRWGSPMRYRAPGGEEVKDPQNRAALLNTFRLKEQFFGMVGKRFERGRGQDPHTRIVLPQNVPEDWIEQSASEFLTKDKSGRRLVWKHRGPNHWSDTNVYAYAAALQLNPFQKGLTHEERRIKAQRGGGSADRQRPKAGRTKRRRGVRRSY